MILVFFRGHGEWFIPHADGSLRLAITRTTIKPYKDLKSYARALYDEPIDYDEWLGWRDDTKENFAEWLEMFGDFGGDKIVDTYHSKDHEYNIDLQGVFFRTPNAKGDIYNTDELRCLGVECISCPKTQGIFKLNTDDEAACRLAGFDAIKNDIKELLPCSHNESAFVKMVSNGQLSSDNIEKYRFLIQDKFAFDCFKSKPIEHPYTLTLVISPQTSQTMQSNKPKKIDRNKILLVMLGMAMDGYGYGEKDPYKTENEISENIKTHGINIDANKIKSYLLEALELKPTYETDKPKNNIDIKSNELKSLFLLILGMAIDVYDYLPDEPSNEATGRKHGISAKISTFGISVTNDVIRNYLTQANEINKQVS